MSTRTEAWRRSAGGLDATADANAAPDEAAAARPGVPGGRRILIAVLALAALIAAYTGFRLPNAWSATLQSVSIFDGVWRRFVIGTALRPLASLTNQSYFVFAAFSYLVLAAVIAVVCTAAVRARHGSQYLLVVAWFLLPTGGYLFNEIGYFEQVLYLLLFSSIYLVHRDRMTAATVVISVAPFVHEIAIVTVIPIFGLVMLRHVSFRRAVVFTLIPTAFNAVVFALPVASGQAIDGLTARLSTAGFPFRSDAIALFKARAGGYRDVSSVVREVRPVAIALAAAFAGLWLCERRTWLRRRDLQHPALLAIASCVAIAAPFMAAYGGWDGYRWLFLIECNFVVVVWLALHYRAHSALAIRSLAVLAAALLALSHVHLMYFDDLAPRLLSRREIMKFIGSIKDRSLFVVADITSRWTP